MNVLVITEYPLISDVLKHTIISMIEHTRVLSCNHSSVTQFYSHCYAKYTWGSDGPDIILIDTDNLCENDLQDLCEKLPCGNGGKSKNIMGLLGNSAPSEVPMSLPWLEKPFSINQAKAYLQTLLRK
ncbi:putative Response regulatory domain-containing protein [Vibrio crassostreae]|nr:putative Response regulatory domain-containing protein [Vibrio crassostreae]CAK2276197.1 putative Response regulatory domain-containing protein [Vibrio crassostreae]CAK2412756.1 putative Response regulatory domain-containing protein [Vibrio crassostreae]CAK2646187.1 putative Response regulatory domain-containing protein [Vibrio crassostreae]